MNGGSSFESELLSRTKHCQVWGYDFTLSSFGDEINNPHSSDFSRFFAQPVQPFYSSDPLAASSSPSSQDDHVGADVGEEAGEKEKAEEGAKEYWNDAGRTLKQRAHFKSYGVAGKDVAPTSEAPPMYTIESLMKMNGAFFFVFTLHFSIQISLLPPSSITLARRSLNPISLCGATQSLLTPSLPSHPLPSSTSLTQATPTSTSSKSISKAGNSTPSPPSSNPSPPSPSANYRSSYISGTAGLMSC